jgi:AraC-like DNA-binding protein
MELVILLDDAARNRRESVISGAHSESFVIDTVPQAAIIGVHFKPGGAFPFLGIPAGELHNTHAPLEALWGRKAGVLRERLLEAPTPLAKFRALEQSLLAQTKRPLVRHAEVAFALAEFESDRAHTVGEVTDRMGLSPRRFIQLFTDEVGLTPKLYCRIRRFQKVLRRIHRRQRVNWVDVALSFGYYDQPHFVRDFRAFSGISPTTYLQLRTEHLNHVPLAD